MKKHSFSPMRPALTMLEVIFVIVILGIVSSIGAEVIANVYESYIVQRAQYRANAKTELALQQIANRLRYAIPTTVYAVNGSTYTPISNVTNSTSEALQWVGYDADSFGAISAVNNRRPGWSGFIDLDASTMTSLSTPGSNLNLTNTIISNLGGTGITGSYIYFPDYSYTSVSGGSGETLSVSSLSGRTLWERYKLAWSSYALKVEGSDLYLYYNFPPTPQAPLGNTKSLLLQNVKSFRFKGSEGSLRIKICRYEPIGKNSTDIVRSCKEKVVF